MKQIIKIIVKYICLFLIGAISYPLIEIAYRGRTHWTMAILGGICFIGCGLINNLLTFEMPLIWQMTLSSVFITTLELVFGLIINTIMGLNVWNYANLPLNFLGQICLPFTLVWFLISAPVIVLDDIIRWKWFDEIKPHYHLLKWGEHSA